MASVEISDVAIWIKHIDQRDLQIRLRSLREDETIDLETDGVVGRWIKMKTGSDGRETDGLRPEGSMRQIWHEWFKTRRGARVEIKAVRLADDYLPAIASLFPEWASAEDEAAFRDL